MTKQRIREWVSEFGIDGVYVSFSGGKDSTVLQIFVAWIKKLLKIKSPSAIYCSDGKYEYAYDFIMKTKSKIKG